MRLGVFGGAALVALIIALLAILAVRRPLGAKLQTWFDPLSAASIPNSTAEKEARVRFHPVASGFDEPVDLQFVPGSPGQAVVLEKKGRARWIRLGALTAGDSTGGSRDLGVAPPSSAREDIVSLPVHSHSELGLLGLAFHPRYEENGLLYLNHNPRDGGPLRTRVSEWHLPLPELGKRRARASRVLLDIDQPYANHDGGQLVFGPDGYLYIGMGDGGHRGDPQDLGQDLRSLLGKILRIDVNARPGYAVPRDNPFVDTPGARPEIWAYGVRNPWRFSFDPQGRLVAADVGQDSYEEVDLIGPGDNLGWRLREGAHCFSPREGCRTEGLVDPIFEYEHAVGSSVTGGQVYLGRELPWLTGKYVLADFVSGRVWALDLPEEPGPARATELGKFPHAISAFARDAAGELYALDFTRGLVLRLAPA